MGKYEEIREKAIKEEEENKNERDRWKKRDKERGERRRGGEGRREDITVYWKRRIDLRMNRR